MYLFGQYPFFVGSGARYKYHRRRSLIQLSVLLGIRNRTIVCQPSLSLSLPERLLSERRRLSSHSLWELPRDLPARNWEPSRRIDGTMLHLDISLLEPRTVNTLEAKK